MGGNSSSLNQSVRNNIVSTATNSAVMKFANKNAANIGIATDIKVTIEAGGNVTIGSGFKVRNQVLAQMKLVNDIAKDIDLAFLTDLAQGVENDIDATLSATNGAGAISVGNNQNLNVAVHNEMSSAIDNVVEIDNIAEIMTNMDIGASTEFIVRAGGDIVIGDDFEITTDVQLDLLASQTVNEVITLLMETQSVQDVMNDIASELEARNDGINDVVDSVGGVLSGLLAGLMAPLIIGVVGIMIVVIIVVVLRASKKKPEPPPAPPPPPPA
jgi:hypothetical protein